MYTCYSYHYNQSTFEYNKPKEKDSTEAFFATQLPIKHSLKPLWNETKGHIWHQQLGHLEKEVIKHLFQSVMGAILKGPTTVKCQL